MGHLLFIGHVAQVGAGVATGSLAGGHGFVEFLLVEVHQGQLRTLGSQVLPHGAAEALAATGDDDDLVFQLHVFFPSNNCRFAPAGTVKSLFWALVRFRRILCEES
ncbi:hypothetical protein FQZ97_1276060 [compost metagenome]